jgi:hypothetical protein
MTTRVRLLKVIVQPVVVIDDGETLTELVGQPATVSAAQWPTYATTEFAAAMEQLRQQVEEPTP